MNTALISTILNSVWAINQDSVKGFVPLINSILSGRSFWEGKDLAQLREAHRSNTMNYTVASSGVSKQRRFGVVKIHGVVMKNDQQCGPEGTITKSKQIIAFDNDPDIDAILLDIDSPGGQADGTQTLVDTIRNTRKPVAAFVSDGMAASAAMWIASAADEIISSHDTNLIGSIGAMMNYVDDREYWESLGVKFNSIYADDASEKNSEYRALMEGNTEPYKQKILNPLNNAFVNGIKKNRRGKLKLNHKTLFKGAIFTSSEALEVGLIDAIGDENFALKRLSALTDKSNSSKKTNTKMSNITTNKWARTFAALNATELDATEEGVVLNNEQMDTIEQSLAASEAVQTQLETANANLETANSDLSAANENIATLEARIQELEKSPSASSTQPATGNSDNDSSPSTDAEAAHFSTVGKQRQERIARMRK
ncbi:S49 family peptidase [Limibacter armeniacum]|uniref:S49 family peptidase n=1 Tax=Limibacter armeniacum TaxID=466084 RepID=UPI002FE60B7A